MRLHLAEIEGFVSLLYGRYGILRLTKTNWLYLSPDRVMIFGTELLIFPTVRLVHIYQQGAWYKTRTDVT